MQNNEMRSFLELRPEEEKKESGLQLGRLVRDTAIDQRGW